MQAEAKVGLGVTALMLALVGLRWGLISKHNREDAVAVARPDVSHARRLDEDDSVFLRKQRPDTPKDERALIGKTVWMSAGGQMEYYRDTGKHVDYSKPVGTLPGAVPLVIKDVFEEVPPKGGRAVSRIAAGKGHVLLAFTLPQSADPATLYAMPVGLRDADGKGYTFLSDEILFYDDPRGLYKHWGPAVWAHIDHHEAVPGMSENQCMMALGEVIVPHGETPGDRSITFNNEGHPVEITFVNGKATTVTPAKP